MPKGEQQQSEGRRKRSARRRMISMMLMMMVEQLAVTLLVCSLMIVRVDSVASPSDIISGREFLSILMKPGPVGTVAERGSKADVPLVVAAATEQPPRNRGLRRFRHFFYEQQTVADDEDETILPIEALFAEGTPAALDRPDQMERSGTRPYGRSAARNLKLPATTTTTTTTTTRRTSVRWIAVSASNSSTKTKPTTVDEESEVTTEMVATTTEVQSEPEAKELEPAHHSNSHRSELSVEEVAPMISKQLDHEKPMVEEEVEEGEVKDLEQERKMERIGQRTERARLPPSQRTERKQESKGSLQTVIYHDKKGDASAGVATGEGGRAAQKPVSYSFIGEAVQLPSEPAIRGTHSYSQPARFYSEPARIYSEPARIYSEPAKVYSEPARIYSEPAKVYSQPSSYWQTAYSVPRTEHPTSTEPVPTDPPSTTSSTTTASSTMTTMTTTTTTTRTDSDEDGGQQRNRQRLVFNELDKIPYDQLNAPVDGDETVTLHNAIGKFVPKQQGAASHSNVASVPTQQPTVQPLAPVAGTEGEGDSKIGYVVEGRNYRKYRVEEKTPDGFIVGEYGVLSHNDGNLRGVRYTADSDINPRLIYDALLKFLSL